MQSFIKKTSAPNTATYLTQVSDGNLTAEQALSSLSTGFMKSTTGTGVVTSQANPIPIADGGTGSTSFTTNGILLGHATALTTTSAGTNNTVLKGNTGAAPTFGQVVLTTDVTGVLPLANGGTNNSTAYTAGSIIFSDGTKLTQDNANFFWHDTVTRHLLLGGTTVAAADIALGETGGAVFNEQGSGVAADFIIQGDTATKLFVVDYSADSVEIGTTVQGAIAKFSSTEVVFNENAGDIDWKATTGATGWYTDASADQVGMGTSTPHSTLDVRVPQAILLGHTSGFRIITANTTADDDSLWFLSNPAVASSITVTLPAATNKGQIIGVKRINALAVDTTTISPAGADTINGGGSITLNAQFNGRILIADGTSDWRIISSF